MKFYPDKDGLERYGLGPTESLIMEYLWSCTSPRTLSQVYECRNGGRAKTTINTTLVRLTRKGLLVYERPTGYTYFGFYRPAEPRATWEARQLAAVRAALEDM